MSSQTTSDLGLHVWEPEDDFLRTEFNDNFAAIDSAMETRPAVVIGSYTGNGAASQTIDLGATPKMVMITYNSLPYNSGDYYGGAIYPGAGSPGAAIVTGGFRAYYDSHTYGPRGNDSGHKYQYTALL